MTAGIISCPYCNSSLRFSTPPSCEQQVRCPRCHELFHIREGEVSLLSGPALESSETAPAALNPFAMPQSSGTRRWSNRSVAWSILGVMALMACLGLAFAWYTTEARRRYGQSETSSSGQRVAWAAPATLYSLGYLPADTNVIAGLHVAELMADGQTRDLLENPEPGSLAVALQNLQGWTGLKLEEMDHVVFGLNVERRGFPRATLVVQTRKPYDTGKLRATMAARRRHDPSKRDVYNIGSKDTGIQGVLWCASHHTLVFVLVEKELDDIPLAPILEVTRFPSPLPRLLDEMCEGAQAWIIGRASDWNKVLTPQLLPGLPQLALPIISKEDRQLLSKARTFGAWVRFDAQASAYLQIACIDAKAAGALDKEFQHRISEDGLLGRRLSPLHLNWYLNDNWLSADGKTSVAGIRQALGTGKE